MDLHNVQGDILAGLPKKVETYFFFKITHVDDFRSQLIQLLPLLTTTAQVIEDQQKIAQYKGGMLQKGRLLELSGVNLAFSQKGLEQMGIGKDANDRIGDTPFEAGMLNDTKLNDDTTLWEPAFKEDIHGLIIITGDCQARVDAKLEGVKKILDCAIHTVKVINGKVRPGGQDGHEHFGYLDGVSQPAVLGVDQNLHRGQETVRQGIILLGREGDSVAEDNGVDRRPSWSHDGSFLCFRYLFQNVLEFDKFVKDNNPPEAADDLFGARLVGRWKSGAPIDVTPLQDDKQLGNDPSRNDVFRYDPFSQNRCPYIAHTRKTNPRSDLSSTEKRRIIRRGIPFGPEVTEAEKEAKKTIEERGLLFVAYQSNIANGFQFIQGSWANQPGFPFLFTPDKPKPGFTALTDPDFTPDKGPGFDAIIGQASEGDRVIDIQGGSDDAGKFTLPQQWVVPKGGEYFFSPSISALKDTFAKEKSALLLTQKFLKLAHAA